VCKVVGWARVAVQRSLQRRLQRQKSHFFVGASSAVAVQAVVAAKGGDHGGGNTIGADATKAEKPGSSHQEKGDVGVAPEEEAEYDAAGGSAHDVPGASLV
jgi:hypothetical protein